MNACDLFAGAIKSELNFLLWEEPFHTPNGWDWGWFCREHALLAAVISELSGFKAKIVIGDYAIVSSQAMATSFEPGSDHAWNIVNGVAPIDISLSVRRFVHGDDVTLVCPGHPLHRAGFDVICSASIDLRSVRRLQSSQRKIIAYRESLRIEGGALELLRDPYSVLYQPPAGCPTFTEAYGQDALHAIAWHALLLKRGARTSLREGRSPDEAIRAICRDLPGARSEVENQLRRSGEER